MSDEERYNGLTLKQHLQTIAAYWADAQEASLADFARWFPRTYELLRDGPLKAQPDAPAEDDGNG